MKLFIIKEDYWKLYLDPLLQLLLFKLELIILVKLLRLLELLQVLVHPVKVQLKLQPLKHQQQVQEVHQLIKVETKQLPARIVPLQILLLQILSQLQMMLLLNQLLKVLLQLLAQVKVLIQIQKQVNLQDLLQSQLATIPKLPATAPLHLPLLNQKHTKRTGIQTSCQTFHFGE